MTNKDKQEKHLPFGLDDNSYVAKLKRGELKSEYKSDLESKVRNENSDSSDRSATSSLGYGEVVFWETASIREEDQTIIVVVNGQQKYEYKSDDPNYQKVLTSLRKEYPELTTGKICKHYSYKDGREEVITDDLKSHHE